MVLAPSRAGMLKLPAATKRVQRRRDRFARVVATQRPPTRRPGFALANANRAVPASSSPSPIVIPTFARAAVGSRLPRRQRLRDKVRVEIFGAVLSFSPPPPPPPAPATWTVTVAIAESDAPSLPLYVNVSVPVKSLAGV